MRAMVTGGAGFIGSVLVDRLLAEGHEVDVVDDLSTGSLTQPGRGPRHRRQGAAHPPAGHPAARDGRPDRAAATRGRLPPGRPGLGAGLGGRTALRRPRERARHPQCARGGPRAPATDRVVFAASGGTLYGDPDAASCRITETLPHRPLSPYGVSKKAGHRLPGRLPGAPRARVHARSRWPTSTGPRQDPHGESGVVAIFAERLVRGQPVTIDGDGEQTRDFVYVDDVVDAFVRASARGGGLVCNVGTGIGTSVNEIYRVLAEAAGVADARRARPATTGRRPPQLPRPRPGRRCSSGGSPGRRSRTASAAGARAFFAGPTISGRGPRPAAG